MSDVTDVKGNIRASLNSSIVAGATSLTVDDEFTSKTVAVPGYLAIGEAADYQDMTVEFVRYDGFTRNGDGTSTFSSLTRGVDNTSDQSWNSGVTVGANIPGELLSRLPAQEENLDMGGNSINNLLPPLTRNDTGAFLSQAGSSTWKNRTYEGWEIVDMATTYTIGSAGDYSTVYAASQDLRGLILNQWITLQLQENITETSQVSFKGLLGVGGAIEIDTNSYTLTLNDYLNFNTPCRFYPRGGGTIKAAVGSAPAYLLRLNQIQWGNLYNITLDANSEVTNQVVSLERGSKFQFNSFTFSNISTGCNEVRSQYGAIVDSKISLTDYVVRESGILFLSDGTLVTENGTISADSPA